MALNLIIDNEIVELFVTLLLLVPYLHEVAKNHPAYAGEVADVDDHKDELESFQGIPYVHDHVDAVVVQHNVVINPRVCLNFYEDPVPELHLDELHNLLNVENLQTNCQPHNLNQEKDAPSAVRAGVYDKRDRESGDKISKEIRLKVLVRDFGERADWDNLSFRDVLLEEVLDDLKGKYQLIKHVDFLDCFVATVSS